MRLMLFLLLSGWAMNLYAACAVTTNGDNVYGHYPRFTELSDGSVLLTTDAPQQIGDRVGNAIRVYRSNSDMNRWEELVLAAFNPPVNFSNAHSVVLKAKGNRPETILMTFRAWEGANSWIDLVQSTDGGKSWQFRSQVFFEGLADKTRGESEDPAAQVEAGVYEPMLVVSHDGYNPNGNETLWIAYASEVSANADEPFANGEQVILIQRSVDQGFRWDTPREATPLTLHQRYGMPALMLYQGNLLLFYETVDLTPNPLYDWLPFYKRTARWDWSIEGSYSLDQGATWAGPVRIFDSEADNYDNANQQITYSGAPFVHSLRVNNTEMITVVFQVGDVPNLESRATARISLYAMGFVPRSDRFALELSSPLPAPAVAWWPTLFQHSSSKIVVAGDFNACVEIKSY